MQLRAIEGYSSAVRRFLILLTIVSLTAGNFAGLVHAEPSFATGTELPTAADRESGETGERGRDSCHVCSHGLVHLIGIAVLASRAPIFSLTTSSPEPRSAAISWLDHPAGEPPK